MSKSIVFDFSRVLLFPKDPAYLGSLNELHRSLQQKPDYHLLEHFFLNQELLQRLSALKSTYRLFIFTSETIQDDTSLQLILSPLFEGIFSALKLGIMKTESSSYEILAKEIGLRPEEILYVDDNLDNIHAAQETGMECIHFKDNEQLLVELPN